MDLLYHLGFEQNRWNAVVWLIKRLVEKFPARHSQSPRLSRVNALWDKVSLEEFCNSPSELNLESSVPRSGMVEAKSLHELTDGLPPEKLSREEVLRHDALGQIWLTLGSMVTACAEVGDIKPEVLEIIAYLHHKEVMPLSIYQAEPPAERSAIHQPPLLSMLSSRILTSLSDAAWRAHEKMVVEEAKAAGGDYAALRPEVPGSVYRVNVAGLRPEVWLELILWSCLHGGWIEQGAEILAPLGKQNSTWRVFSWREYEDMIAANSSGGKGSWNDLEYLFKTRAAAGRDAPQEPGLKVPKTVSAEAANAFIDSLVTMVNVGVGSRGLQVKYVLERIGNLKDLLLKSKFNRRASLSTGTWDSLVLRIMESRSIGTENDSGLVRQAVRLSPGLGQGLGTSDTRDLPEYVLDGSMAMQGLFHRALHGQIMAGSFEGAWKVFKSMQGRADKDKSRSLTSFMKGEQPLLRSLTRGDMFTSNLPGIDYPAFDLQIPPTTLGSLLELATEAEAYDFARWLLYNDDVDGPIIRESLYTDPHVQPAVIRFAAEALDHKVLSKLRKLGIQKASLTSMLDSQINHSRWDAAERILHHISVTPSTQPNAQNLANVIRVMLLQVPGASAGDTECQTNLDRARKIAADIISGRWDSDEEYSPTQTLLAVLSAVDPTWQRFCAQFRQPRRYIDFSLHTRSFNAVLAGVTAAYGSAAGRRLLGIFWPHSARRAHDASFTATGPRQSRMRMSQYRPTVLDSIKRQRIRIPMVSRDGKPIHDLIVYGACTPNTGTIMIILRKALQELQSETKNAAALVQNDESVEKDWAKDSLKPVDTSPRGMVTWGARRLLELPYVEKSIIDRIDQVLAEVGMEDLRGLLPRIVDDVEAEFEEEANNQTEAMNSVKDEFSR